MARLHCPVPSCPKNNFARQVKVNEHLRDIHKIKLESQHGGNMQELKKRQQKQFSEWLKKNGHPDRSLFATTPSESVSDEVSQTDEDLQYHGDDESESQASDVPESDDDDPDKQFNKPQKQKAGCHNQAIQRKKTPAVDDTLQMIKMEPAIDRSGLDVRPKSLHDMHKPMDDHE